TIADTNHTPAQDREKREGPEHPRSRAQCTKPSPTAAPGPGPARRRRRRRPSPSRRRPRRRRRPGRTRRGLRGRCRRARSWWWGGSGAPGGVRRGEAPRRPRSPHGRPHLRRARAHPQEGRRPLALIGPFLPFLSFLSSEDGAAV
uniref:Uncharacterized protein n=1 Tax=Aegilops tauschii subsp. strangulata TaxID=200361 RepID=A0A453F792_AEGTS